MGEIVQSAVQYCCKQNHQGRVLTNYITIFESISLLLISYIVMTWWKCWPNLFFDVFWIFQYSQDIVRASCERWLEQNLVPEVRIVTANLKGNMSCPIKSCTWASFCFDDYILMAYAKDCSISIAYALKILQSWLLSVHWIHVIYLSIFFRIASLSLWLLV